MVIGLHKKPPKRFAPLSKLGALSAGGGPEMYASLNGTSTFGEVDSIAGDMYGQTKDMWRIIYYKPDDTVSELAGWVMGDDAANQPLYVLSRLTKAARVILKSNAGSNLVVLASAHDVQDGNWHMVLHESVITTGTTGQDHISVDGQTVESSSTYSRDISTFEYMTYGAYRRQAGPTLAAYFSGLMGFAMCGEGTIRASTAAIYAELANGRQAVCDYVTALGGVTAVHHCEVFNGKGAHTGPTTNWTDVSYVPDPTGA